MLNPTLYTLLIQRFGEVKITNQGESLVGEYKYDPIYDKTVLDIAARGETYCVSCPYCHESRQRLYINHRYGVWDRFIQSSNTHLVRCFNEDCFKHDTSLYRDLHEKLFGMLNVEQRRTVNYLSGSKPTALSLELTEVGPPGEVSSLLELPASHPANQYLMSRGYDIEQLVNRWKLMYCSKADKGYYPAQHRIVIPIIQDKKWCGWQCRYVGDIDWKAQNIPKSYTLPSMPKRLVLYGLDHAKTQSFVVVVEGPPAAWTLYPYGVAILGKQASIQQQRLIAKHFKDKPVIILLDGDAQGDADRLYNQLKLYIKTISKVTLPPDKDPGDYNQDLPALWKIIEEQAGLKLQELM